MILSNEVKILLPEHAVRLQQIQDENGNYTKLTDFINAMLYQDREHCRVSEEPSPYYVEDYIKIMAEQSNMLRETSVPLVMSESITREEYDRIVGMDIFWKSLDYLTRDDKIFFVEKNENVPWRVNYEKSDYQPWYLAGESLLQIKDFEVDEHKYIDVTVMLCDRPYSEGSSEPKIYNEVKMCLARVKDPVATGSYLVNDYVKQLEEERDVLWQKYMFKAPITVLGTFCPNAGAVMETVYSVMTHSASGTLEEGASIELDNERYNVLEHLPEGLQEDFPEAELQGAVKTIALWCQYKEEEAKLLKQIDEMEEFPILSWFYSTDACRLDADKPVGEDEFPTVHFQPTISEPDMLRAIDDWNQQGCSSFVEGIEPELLWGEVLNRNLSEETKAAVEFMIFGNSEAEGYKPQYSSVLQIAPPVVC